MFLAISAWPELPYCTVSYRIILYRTVHPAVAGDRLRSAEVGGLQMVDSSLTGLGSKQTMESMIIISVVIISMY